MQMNERIAERLKLPKSIVHQATLAARRPLPGKKRDHPTIPAISAYPLLYSCRSVDVAHVSHMEILAAYTDAGYVVSKSRLMRISLESTMPLPQVGMDELVRAALDRLQSSESVVARLRSLNLDSKTYFTRLFDLAREVAAEARDLAGFSPRTIAAGSVYVASLALSAKTFTQREAGETLGMAEYTIREFCGRTRNRRGATEELPVQLVKSEPGRRRP